MRRLSSALFVLGLGVLIAAVFQTVELDSVAPIAGQAINAAAADQVGAANFVTAVVLAYRGFDTLLELTILFTAATAGGLVGAALHDLDGLLGQLHSRRTLHGTLPSVAKRER